MVSRYQVGEGAKYGQRKLCQEEHRRMKRVLIELSLRTADDNASYGIYQHEEERDDP
jgi:hypothetical protein